MGDRLAASFIGGWMGSHRAQLRLGVRIIVASLVSYIVAHLLGFTQSYWAVLTAVIVMQASVGGALKATIDRFVGSVGGAIWGVIVSLYVPHADVWSLGLALTAATAPLAVVAAIHPTYRVAPITAIILVLAPSQTAGPVAAAILRLEEIGLGSVVAIAVSLLVLPARAHGVVAEAAGRVLSIMSELMGVIAAGLTMPIDQEAVQSLHDLMRGGIGQAETGALETLQERSRFLTTAPDQEPMVRTLRRMRNGLAMIGRAVAEPFDKPVRERLVRPATALSDAIAAYFRDAATALSLRKPAPSLEPMEQALRDYEEAVAILRESGLTRKMPGEAVGRLFALAFGLEQLHRDMADLADRVNELAAS